VLDIFAGSNTTGAVAEIEGRRWLAFEERQDYLAASVFRFMAKDTPATKLETAFEALSTGMSVDLTAYETQVEMFRRAAE